MCATKCKMQYLDFQSLSFKKYLFYLFIWQHWVLVVACRTFTAVQGFSSCGVQA